MWRNPVTCRLLVRTFLLQGAGRFFKLFLQMDPQTHQYHQFCLIFVVFHRLKFKQSGAEHLSAFSTRLNNHRDGCLSSAALLLQQIRRGLPPCSSVIRHAVLSKQNSAAWGATEKETPHVAFAMPQDNGHARSSAFPGFCWMQCCSWARNKVVLVTAC